MPQRCGNSTFPERSAIRLAHRFKVEVICLGTKLVFGGDFMEKLG